jgi:hypothetical protein
MNQLKPNNSGVLIDTTPLFASVWLALFNVLRKNYSERRQAAASHSASLNTMEKQ